MDRSAVITLVSETRTQDAYGVWRPAQTTRDVYAQVDSVTRSEFFEGGRNGLNPEYVFRMFQGAYKGEKICVYCGTAYSIYRTYNARNDTIELYAERKEGVNLSEGDTDGKNNPG